MAGGRRSLLRPSWRIGLMVHKFLRLRSAHPAGRRTGVDRPLVLCCGGAT
jgi:hypothetical protein